MAATGTCWWSSRCRGDKATVCATQARPDGNREEPHRRPQGHRGAWGEAGVRPLVPELLDVKMRLRNGDATFVNGHSILTRHRRPKLTRLSNALFPGRDFWETGQWRKGNVESFGDWPTRSGAGSLSRLRRLWAAGRIRPTGRAGRLSRTLKLCLVTGMISSQNPISHSECEVSSIIEDFFCGD